MKIFLSFVLGLILSTTSFADPAGIAGTWRTIDDKTGFSKALIEIKKESDGSYSGTIVKILPRPNYTPKEFCQHCPPPFTDKPILGMTVLWGLKQDANQPKLYDNAQLIDPLSGKLYKGKVKLNADGRQLLLRGYIGISMLGRTQTWIREN